MAPLSKWVIVWVAAGIAVFTACVVVWLWWGGTSGLNGDKLVAARFDALRTGLSIGLGTGGAFALYLAWRRQHSIEIGLLQKQQDQADVANAYALQERTALASEADAAARRITELYTKAVEQLGSDKAPVRLGGLYALERLAQDNKSQRQTIVNVLCAYLRMPYALAAGQGQPTDDDEKQALAHREERQVRLTAQRILATHLHPGVGAGQIVDAFWADVDLDLTGAVLIHFDLSRCTVRAAVFESAEFMGDANFRSTTFTNDVNFNSANFADDAIFEDGIFKGDAWFIRANFTCTANFASTTFDGETGFTLATLTETTYAGAVVTGSPGASGVVRPFTSFSNARFKRGVPPEAGRFLPQEPEVVE